ncbi:MAG: hypothetical protein ISS36_04040, partial [Candidatus Aenigmarchaeota archaeon]|nr:hypothetical protein [Candidatus Aenigmarchaeota archaeon]
MVRRKNIVLFSAIVTMLFLSLTFAGAESLEKTVTVKSSYGDSGIDGVKVMIYPLPLGDEIFDGEETVIEVFPLEKCEVFDSTVNCFKPLTTIDVCTTEDGKCTFEKTVNAWQPDISWFLSTSDCEEIASESECRMNWGRCMWDITDWELWWGNVENPTTEQQKCIPGWGYEILPDECFMCKGRIAQAYDIWNALKYKDIAIDFERHPLYNDVGVGEFTTQYEIDAANAHYCIKAIDENGDAIPNALVRLAFYRGAWKDPSTWDDPTQNSFYDGKDTPGISGEYSSHTRRWYIPEYHAIWQETFDYFVPSVYRESNLDIPYERFKVESTRWHHEVDWYDGHYVAFRSDENGELDLPINLPFCSNANYEKNQHGPKDQKIFYERRVYMQYPANPSLNHYETKLKEMRLGDYNPEFCFRKARAQVINIEYASYEPLSTDNLPESAIVPLSGFEDVAFSVVPCDEEYNEIGITGSCTIEDIYDVSNSKP